MSIRHDRDHRYRKPRNRKTRPKTFKSEESAKAWAEKNKIKSYELMNLRLESSKTKKIRVVVK